MSTTPQQVKVGGPDANVLNDVYVALALVGRDRWESKGWVLIEGQDWYSGEDGGPPTTREAVRESQRFAKETHALNPGMVCIGVQIAYIRLIEGEREEPIAFISVMTPDEHTWTVTAPVLLGERNGSAQWTLASGIACALFQFKLD